MKRKLLFTLFLSLFFTLEVYAQTGKISGTVTDAETDEPLPGVNLVLEGTDLGAATNQDGQYTILNVDPGEYDLQASYIGYATVTVEGITVNANLTTRRNIQMQTEALAGEEVVVTAMEPVVKPDVSSNVANVSAVDIENIPVAGVSEAINLQAGIEPGLSIRGSGSNELQFVVNGMNLENPKDNAPMTNISYTAIDRYQVQTGGFNAEYGNVRSGVVNVNLKQPGQQFNVDFLMRYHPPSKKYFGMYPDDPNAYWMRPRLDPEVAYEGTDNWDPWTRRQYPDWQGWNQLSQALMENEYEEDDLTPDQLIEVFKWYHRKDFEIKDPDYQVDGTISGPVPGLYTMLGDLRFRASYRQDQLAYTIPMRRSSDVNRTGMFSLYSSPSDEMRLELFGYYNRENGMAPNWSTSVMQRDRPSYPWSWHTGLANHENNSNWHNLFGKDSYAVADIWRNQAGAKFTHTLSSRTFYELEASRSESFYRIGPGPLRDTETVLQEVGGLELTEEPFGFLDSPTLEFSPGGMKIGGRWATGRDSSFVEKYAVKADLTSQITQAFQLKTGIRYWNTDYKNISGIYNPAQPNSSNPKEHWHRYLTQGAAYAQSKLEFEGMVANLGVRLDYLNPVGEWYEYPVFSRAFATNDLIALEQVPIDQQLVVSPRLGISYPITVNSKVYFNYGHFTNIQYMPNMFRIEERYGGSNIGSIGNPNLPMQKTISYELGYDQNILESILLRISGYYKANEDQPRGVQFTSIDGQVDYNKSLPLNYSDVRGVEFTLEKDRGRWFRGFANFTYMVSRGGNFGYNQIYENRADMQSHIRESTAHYQWTPTPQPYGRVSLDFFTPQGYGPDVMGFKPLQDWRFNLLYNWRYGDVFTWRADQSELDVTNNIKWRDWHMVDLRLSKNFRQDWGRVQLFLDVDNVFNLKYIWDTAAWVGPRDEDYYMRSLHLPEDTFSGVEEPYDFIYGDDQPGDMRKTGVEYQPIEIVSNVDDVGSPHIRPLYYEKDNDRYMVWENDSWQQADQGFVDQVMEDKAYIDMPNSDYLAYLFPRRVYLGIRISF